MFLLIGFDENSEERLQMGQLIRKGWGTIYWEMNDTISHLIVADGCEESVRYVSLVALDLRGFGSSTDSSCHLAK